MVGMDPSPPGAPRRPDTWVPPRPDLGWQHLPPTVGAPRRRRGLVAIVAIITTFAIVGSLSALGGVINEATRAKGSSDEYRFLAMSGGKPVRWNPCEAIHYVVNLQDAPEGSLQDVQEAVRRVSADTGVTFLFDGSTPEIPQDDRPPYLPTYGDRWAPVVIAWAYQDDTTVPFQKGDERYAAVARPIPPPDGTPPTPIARGGPRPPTKARPCCTSSATSWVSTTWRRSTS
jgi:hypothetical protein